jgi:Domain of unknown function (DUF6471)
MMVFATEMQMHAEELTWAEKVKGMLRAEMARRALSYRELAEKLAAIGVTETEANLRNKVSRGGFTAAFFVQCLAAMGVKEIRIE